MPRSRPRSPRPRRATTAKRDRIRLNMERWRWLPRDLGAEVHHRQRPGIPRDSGREWRQSMETARDRRQAVDANAAAQRAGDGRDPQSLVGGPEEHREGSRGKEGIRRRERCRRQDPALAPAAGTDQRTWPIEVRDAELEGDLPSRHQRAQPLQRRDPGIQPRLRPHRSISSTLRPSCSATTVARGRRRRSRRRSTARRRVQANFVKPLPVYIVYFSAAALVTAGSSTTRICTAATPRRWRRST